jgi:hypothetical protein
MERYTKRGIVVLGICALAAGYYGHQAVETPPQPIWEYTSNPPHPLGWDRVARTVADPLMYLLYDGKITHVYDWIDEPMRPEYKGMLLPHDPTAFP